MCEAKIQWPANALGSGDDLGVPLVELQRRLELLGEGGDEDKVTARRTPYSLQIITAGTLAISKVVTPVIGGLGLVGSGLMAFFAGQGAGPQVALILGAAVLASATILGIALIVVADVNARSRGSAAQYEARAQVATAFLTFRDAPIEGPIPKRRRSDR